MRRQKNTETGMICSAFEVHEVLHIVCETHVALKIYLFLLCQMALLDGKSFPTMGYFFKTLIFSKFGRYLDRRLPQNAVQASTVLLKNDKFKKHIFYKKNIKIKKIYCTANPRTQKVTLQEEARIKTTL